MSDMKCKVCGEDAEVEFDGEYYCKFCMNMELYVWRQDAPHIYGSCTISHLCDWIDEIDSFPKE